MGGIIGCGGPLSLLSPAVGPRFRRYGYTHVTPPYLLALSVPEMKTHWSHRIYEPIEDTDHANIVVLPLDEGELKKADARL